MKIVYLLGTDGAGKTTVAQEMAIRSGGKLTYAYCQVTPILIAPLQWVARRMFLRKANQFRDYSTYSERKRAASSGRRRLARLYCLVWYADFVWQAWLKLAVARLKGSRLIMDRYYLDAVVNQGVIQGNALQGMLADARLLERFVPKPEKWLFLDVDERTAFARKDDIQSVGYLRERKERYLQLAPPYGFQSIDANRPLEAVLADAQTLILDVPSCNYESNSK